MNKEKKKELKEIDNRIEEYKDIKREIWNAKCDKATLFELLTFFVASAITIPLGFCINEMILLALVPFACADVALASIINFKLDKKVINRINENAMYYYIESNDVDENMENLDDLILEEKVNKKMYKYKEKSWNEIKTPEELYEVIDTIQKCLGDNLEEDELKYLKKAKKLVKKYTKEDNNKKKIKEK